ncbi:MRPL55 [Lepeophtheirus salmonis]|uniref:39S ribosomal protein L55, mitochondrial n=2 Tax=Lepeophtheirus salmonis TaxID=72036 RepID=D3PIE7_LEPSM|nr:39S ribosomal protein L55, mitochondrial-like [Lepeophtheirus salmonis]ADD38333.1 39S ribosomal protein L55, mitochondrial [Lepeophtheirus salmonis]CAB4069809.1 MRPL55 [Lepeophtheirus salmonis]CAF3034816.1 MRPL55 [Lepeophtheirus salmonis]
MMILNQGKCVLYFPRIHKICVRELNANKAVITSVRRPHPTRTYPTLLVTPDGSTYNIKYSVPRQIIKLPIDMEKCSEEDRLRVQRLRLKREKVQLTEDFQTSFDPTQYL